MAERERLKDMFFKRDSLRTLADNIQAEHLAFDRDAFLALVFDNEFDERALKAKMHHVTRCLHATLPPHFPDALAVLEAVAHTVTGFDAMLFPDFVEHYGLDHWDLSLPALGYFTQFCSSEFAIRPFIAQDSDRAMAQMAVWARDENVHRRRLASEGCRPRLPWAMALPAFKKDPAPILPILEQLKDDPEEYVRKSVANNLNDISKDHPDLVQDVCERWQGYSPHTDWIVKHACRTMLKAGNRRAMLLFGFADPVDVEVVDLTVDNQTPAIGDSIEFAFSLAVRTSAASKIRLEYGVDYMKARGKHSRKVFKIGEAEYEPGEHSKTRKHAFLERSTRKHYPGEHHIAVIVNGVEKAKTTVELLPET